MRVPVTTISWTALPPPEAVAGAPCAWAPAGARIPMAAALAIRREARSFPSDRIPMVSLNRLIQLFYFACPHVDPNPCLHLRSNQKQSSLLIAQDGALVPGGDA